jgi:hypothetical protein
MRACLFRRNPHRATLGRTRVNDLQDEFLRYGAAELHIDLQMQ